MDANECCQPEHDSEILIAAHLETCQTSVVDFCGRCHFPDATVHLQWLINLRNIQNLRSINYKGLPIEDCDKISIFFELFQLAKARDQLLPLFVMDVLGEFPGLTGLFIAGVFSAALSSLSTCLNSMSAVVLEDFVKPFVNKPMTSRMINWIMRSVVVVVGVICVALVVVVQKMGTVLQLTMSLEAITNGPLLGIFTIGVLLPWINGNVSKIDFDNKPSVSFILLI